MTNGASGPLRTCVGCRQRRPPAELIRVKPAGDTLRVTRIAGVGAHEQTGGSVVEEAGRGTGRGASVCPAVRCAERAVDALLRGRGGRKRAGRKDAVDGSPPGGGGGAHTQRLGTSGRAVLEAARSLLEQAVARRIGGLRRRGLDPTADAAMRAALAMQGRLDEALAAERRRS